MCTNGDVLMFMEKLMMSKYDESRETFYELHQSEQKKSFMSKYT